MAPKRDLLGGVRTLVTFALLVTASALLDAAPSSGANRPPQRLRFRVHSVLWWSNGIGGGRTESTDYFDAAPGEDIDGSRAYPGWQPFAPGAPFRLGAIVDPEHAWIHFSGGIRPSAGGNEPSTDSIIVSTVDRSFTSGSMDAGLEFTVRVEPPSPLDAIGASSGMQLVHHGRVVHGPKGLKFQAGRGALMGRILHAGSSTPIVGASVQVEGSETVSKSTSSGWFELFDLPIGRRRLIVRDSLGEVSAPVEVTDEKVDSLEARVAQPGDADPAARSPEKILAEARALRTSTEEGYVRLYDVAAVPYQRSAPDYPDDARKSLFEGDVLVRARVDSIGRLAELSAQGSVSPQILTAAEGCVRRWRFRPALKDGRPVGCWLGLPVHFAHPASDNVAAPQDRTSKATANFTDDSRTTHASLVVEASATLDSVTMTYRYYYRVMNRGGSTRNLVAFALMPAVPADMNLVKPEGWNGFLGCGGRRDVVGWMVWGDAPRHDTMMDFAIAPGQELAGIGFTSKRPPRRIRWFANTVVGRESGKVIWDCGSSATETMLKTQLQGTIVGPGSDEDR